MTKRYRLASQVTVQKELNGGGSLFISHPQRIIKLSPGGMGALQQLLEHDAAGMSSAITEFAVNLENQGVIIRQFSQVRDELLPTVTIIIPTYGRPKMLGKCLESLDALDYPVDRLEIIVVDDASPEPIDPANWAATVQLIRQRENQGPGAARNLAVQQAKGEIIAFLDDDCIADKGWLRSLITGFQSPDVAIVGGRVEAADLTSTLGKYEQVMSPLLMGDLQRKVRKGGAVSYLPTCNLLVRKNTFLAVGGFDASLRIGEDVDLCWRVLDLGGNIYYLPDGVVYHYHRTKFISFLKRRYDYGQSEALLQGKHWSGNRRLSLFPGHSYILAAAAIITLLIGTLSGYNSGFLFGMAGLVVLDVINLGYQITRNIYRLDSSGYSLKLGQVTRAIIRAHNSSLYLYSQNFSRYYSIILTVLILPVFPLLIFLFMMIHFWPAVVDYGLKKPSIAPVTFLYYYGLENYFYQAGVLTGCWHEHNWRPLFIDITTVGEVSK